MKVSRNGLYVEDDYVWFNFDDGSELAIHPWSREGDFGYLKDGESEATLSGDQVVTRIVVREKTVDRHGLQQPS